MSAFNFVQNAINKVRLDQDVEVSAELLPGYQVYFMERRGLHCYYNPETGKYVFSLRNLKPLNEEERVRKVF